MAEAATLPTEKLGFDMGGIPSLAKQFSEAKTENTNAMKEVETAKKASSDARLAGKEKIDTIQDMAPKPPELEKLPADFKHQGMSEKDMTDSMQTMFLFAALGGAMTRAPMTAALNAFGGALKGMVQGDQALFKRETETFDRHLKTAMTKNTEAMNAYKLAFEKHKGDLGAAMQEIQLEAAAHNDTVTGALARANNAKAIMNQIASMANADARMQQTEQRFQQMVIQQNRQHDERMRQMDLQNRRLEMQQEHFRANEEIARERAATYRQKIEGAGKKGLTGKAADSFVHNESNIEALGEVLTAIDENPDAFGIKTMLPGIVLNRMDSEGTPVRASLANITSMTIKDRAGTAQTASEMKNLAPFIPRDGDDVDTVRTKIKGMIKEMARMNKHLSGNAGAAPAPTSAPAAAVPPTNAKGWKLHEDASGNKAYVGPNNEIEEVK